MPQSQNPRAPSGKIQHVVVMLEENRSFNTLFMGFPGADTATSGPCKITKWAHWCTGQTVHLKPVRLESNGRPGGVDIGHEHRDFKLECDRDASNNCRMDGFDLIRGGTNGEGAYAKLYPYAYVDRAETKPYWDLARRYALADQMFFTDTAASFIAHQEIIAGTVKLNSLRSLTDEPNDSIWGCDAVPGTQTPVLLHDGRELRPRNGSHLPFPCFTEYQTMADLLDAQNVSWKYYVAPVYGPNADFSGAAWNGFDAIKKVRYSADWGQHISRPNTKVFTDIKNGSLPSVSWVIPTIADSDHPGSGCNTGPRWVTKVVNAIGTSRYWNTTAIILLWDDWGGWYDNVPPPQVNYTSLGFRVPMIVISPYAKTGYVSHTPYQFGSVLKFMEQKFGLGSLGTTDATANSMVDIFDFSQAPLQFKAASLPPGLKMCENEPQTRRWRNATFDPG
jgi:phospholipase C